MIDRAYRKSGRPVLVAMSGLPGVGKTTIAHALLKQVAMAYLRIDVIEQAILRSTTFQGGIGPIGYLVGQEIAEANLKAGQDVIADSVNPVAESREGWRQVARQARADLIEIEVICSDMVEHERRVSERESDIAGHRPPDWARVRAIAYDPWDRPRVVIDTARSSPEEGVDIILRKLAEMRDARIS